MFAIHPQLLYTGRARAAAEHGRSFKRLHRGNEIRVKLILQI
jgi:hypothetical protein